MGRRTDKSLILLRSESLKSGSRNQLLSRMRSPEDDEGHRRTRFGGCVKLRTRPSPGNRSPVNSGQPEESE
jgi:hypothetical protein